MIRIVTLSVLIFFVLLYFVWPSFHNHSIPAA